MNDKPKVHVLTAGGAGTTKAVRGTSKRNKAKSELLLENESLRYVTKLQNVDPLMPQKSGQLEYEPHGHDDDVEDVALNDEALDLISRNKSSGPRVQYSDRETSEKQGHSFSTSKVLNSTGGGSSDVIWLVICFFGIMASFVCYGLLLEYTTSGGRKLHELSFLFVTSGLYTVTAAAGRYVRDETPTTIPPRQFALLGLTSMGSTWCSVRSLR